MDGCFSRRLLEASRQALHRWRARKRRVCTARRLAGGTSPWVLPLPAPGHAVAVVVPPADDIQHQPHQDETDEKYI